nr:substrate-binding domain-containing protein [Pectobacterium colocasium]
MTNPLRLYAAGSLRLALTPLLATFSERYAVDVVPTFGPAGLLSEKIIHGDAVDIFASANCAHPLRLKALGLVEETRVFTRNHLCIVMRNVPELTSQSWLMALLDPRFVLSTSTPGSDPGGDYAFELLIASSVCIVAGGDNCATKRNRWWAGARTGDSGGHDGGKLPDSERAERYTH